MSYSELYKWYEYYTDEPFPSDRNEIQMATLTHVVASFAGSKAKHSDFMISNKGKKEPQTVKEFEDDLKQRFSMFAKKEK